MIGQFITNIVQWIVMSSKNPEATSLTLKGSLVALGTAITIILGLGNISVPISQLTPLVDFIVQWVQTALLIVSLTASIYGAVRKLWTTVNGTNKTINIM